MDSCTCKMIIQKGPQNFEVIQQTDGAADLFVSVSFSEDSTDDTRLELPFSPDKVCLRVVSEDDGSYVTLPVPLKFAGETWNAVIPKVPCGGPYLLDAIMFDPENCVEYPVRGERRRHFCVGDIYIIAGQSNAAGMGKGVSEEMPEPGIHVLRNLEHWDLASQPFDEWDYSKHSMFMAFAKKIKRKTGCPIGLIPAAMGGAPLSRWLLEEDGDLYRKMLTAVNQYCLKSSVQYMEASDLQDAEMQRTDTQRRRVRAVLWYQGCTDAGEGCSLSDYLSRFERFVETIRRDLGDEALPVFTFQLNRQRLKEKNPELDKKYDVIREAQRQAAKKLHKVYILPAIDALHMTDFIHGSTASNRMLGERLALQVLKEIYGIGLGAAAPDITEAVLSQDGCRINLNFAPLLSFLSTLNSSCEQFPIQVEDEEGMVVINDYVIHGSRVELILARPCKQPAFVSGQRGTNPENLLIDFGSQLPILCFWRHPVTK